MNPRTGRWVSVVMALALLVGASVGAADVANAKKKKKKKPKLVCQTYVPQVEGAAEGEVLQVNDKHTEDEPLVIEYAHEMAGPGEAGLNDEVFFNIQSYSKQPIRGLNIRMEFADDSDIDLTLYDEAGQAVDSSEAFNPAPIEEAGFDDDGKGGTGYESLSEIETQQCAGYTIGSDAHLTPGTDVTLQVWLAEFPPPEEGLEEEEEEEELLPGLLRH